MQNPFLREYTDNAIVLNQTKILFVDTTENPSMHHLPKVVSGCFCEVKKV